MRTTPKIYNYARVSTTKQLQGVGLETQQQKSVLESLSLEHNLPIHDENFVDQGLSAYHGKHKEGALGIVLTRIKSGEIPAGSILVVFSLDRLSRETVNIAMEQLLSIINQGVRVYTHIDGKMFDSMSTNLTADLIVSLISMERANEESLTKSKRVKAAMREGLRRWRDSGEAQSTLGRVPFWIDQPTNTLNSNADGVRKAIELYLNGVGILSIKKHLDEFYQYTPVRKNNRNKANIDKWDYTAISELFSKPSLIGEKHITIDDTKYRLENYYPPIIDEITFEKLKKIKSTKRGRTPETGAIHLLKGLVKCKTCGSSMVYIDKGRGNNAINYVCGSAAKGNHNRENYSAQMLELVTLAICKDKYLASTVDSEELKTKKISLEATKEELNSSLDDLTMRYKKNSSARILDLIEDTEDKLNRVLIELNELDTPEIAQVFELLSKDVYTKDIMDDYLHPDRAEIRNNLCRILTSIEVGRKVVHSEFTKTGHVACVSIRIKFRNGYIRDLDIDPFSYVIDEGNESIFVPFKYKYDIPNEETFRSSEIISDMLIKLHANDLLNKLYPSKGRYQWATKGLNIGISESKIVNYLPTLDDVEGSKTWNEIFEKFYSRGVKETRIESNRLK
ncbi:TPA: recombinase family protein [Vibrio parahaemolyticus]|nr:recombinase family protein [Vibrio parahaemolyticus]